MMTMQYPISFIVRGPILTAICSIGLLGNAALFLTYALQKRNPASIASPIKPFLMYLATNDFMMLTVSWLLLSLPVYVQLNTNCTFVYMLSYLTSFNYMLHGTHIWCNVALATDRFLAICLPIWTKTRKPKSLHVAMLSFASIISIIYGIPKLLEREFVPIEGNLTKNGMVCRISEDYSEILIPTELSSTSYAYQIGYKIVAKLMIVSTFPTLILLCLTVSMLIKVRNSINKGKRLIKFSKEINKKRERHVKCEVVPLRKYGMDQKESPLINHQVAKALVQQVSMTTRLVLPDHKLHRINCNVKRTNIYKCLISVFIMSVICNTLPTVLNIMDLIAIIDRDTINYLSLISNSLVLLDASSTFFLCVALSTQFRKLLRK